jgi:hypothetical protein
MIRHLGHDPARPPIRPQHLPIGGHQPQPALPDPDAGDQIGGGAHPIRAGANVDAVQPPVGGRDPQRLAVHGQRGRLRQPDAVEQLAVCGVESLDLVRPSEGEPDGASSDGHVPVRTQPVDGPVTEPEPGQCPAGGWVDGRDLDFADLAVAGRRMQHP